MIQYEAKGHPGAVSLHLSPHTCQSLDHNETSGDHEYHYKFQKSGYFYTVLTHWDSCIVPPVNFLYRACELIFPHCTQTELVVVSATPCCPCMTDMLTGNGTRNVFSEFV